MSTEDKALTSSADETAIAEADEKHTMALSVEVDVVGPCRKHIRVRIPRADVDHYFDEAVSEFVSTATVPGFRVGRVPAQLVKKRFRKELGDQVKQKLLMESLDQISRDEKLDPISEPSLDVENIEIPEEGDFEYEFDIEVRPEFDLPNYEGLEIRRPKREITVADVDGAVERFLSQYGKLVPHTGSAESGDHVTVSAEFFHNGELLNRLNELSVRLKPVLRFRDAEVEGFDQLMQGAGVGDIREAEFTISLEAENLKMRGETILAKFTVEDVKRLELPELTKTYLERIGFESDEELRKTIRRMLERQVEYQQRQTVRSQVLSKITESADWELPEKVVLNQVENALRREILEMQQAGFTRQEIQARENELRQKSVTSTKQALKEHFVLDKIASTEDIQVTPQDIEHEIQLMAMQRGESSRRVRARLIKSGMIENLEAQIRERKAVDIILSKAVFKDVPADPVIETKVEAVPHSVCDAVGASPDATAEEDEQAEADQDT